RLSQLSVEELQQFRQTQDIAAAPVARKSDSVTAVRIGFFEAASYCNWLSRQEGIPEEQWCYLPREDGLYAPGMQIAEDHLYRSGYQIPTPDLWEYACRGGTATPRPYGHGVELSSAFVRWMGTRVGTQQRIAYRKPNGFGLFDVLGNSYEWSVGLVERSQMNSPDPRSRGPRFPMDEPGARFGGPRMQGPGVGPLPGLGEEVRHMPRGRPGLAFGGGPKLVDAAGKTVRGNSQFVILGGAFDSPAHKIRSSDRSIISPPYTNKPITLRLMRIVSWGGK
ncbi:MAG: SUMF1/EgtB/PvdO family nonheme iron enzyme, partial [Planctomycetota bacterium]